MIASNVGLLNFQHASQLTLVLVIALYARSHPAHSAPSQCDERDGKDTCQGVCAVTGQRVTVFCSSARIHNNSVTTWYKYQHDLWEIYNELFVRKSSTELIFLEVTIEAQGDYLCKVTQAVTGELLAKETFKMKIFSSGELTEPKIVDPVKNNTVIRRLPGQGFSQTCRSLTGPCFIAGTCEMNSNCTLTWYHYSDLDQASAPVPHCAANSNTDPNVCVRNLDHTLYGNEQMHVLHVSKVTTSTYGYYECVSETPRGRSMTLVHVVYGTDDVVVLDQVWIAVICTTSLLVVLSAAAVLLFVNHKYRFDLDVVLWYRLRFKHWFTPGRAGEYEIGLFYSDADNHEVAVAQQLADALRRQPSPGFTVHTGSEVVNPGENTFAVLNDSFHKVKCLLILLSSKLLDRDSINLWVLFVQNIRSTKTKLVYVVLEDITDGQWDEAMRQSTSYNLRVKQTRELLERSIKYAVSIRFPSADKDLYQNDADPDFPREKSKFYKKLLRHLPPVPYRAVLNDLQRVQTLATQLPSPPTTPVSVEMPSPPTTPTTLEYVAQEEARLLPT